MADGTKSSGQTEKAGQKGECIEPDLYNFGHSRRGVAIIIINEKCANESELRKGCEKDLYLLQTTFTNLGFEIRTFWDQKADKLLNNVYRVSKEDFTKADCLAIAISTHGSEVQNAEKVRHDTIYASDAEIQTRVILEMFNDEKCPTLKGKPRLVFIQACRGVKLDEGVQVKVKGAKTPVKSSGSHGTQRRANRSGDQTDAIPSVVKPTEHSTTSSSKHSVLSPNSPLNHTYVVSSGPHMQQGPPLTDVVITPAPCFLDYLVMYATPPGHYAFRKPSMGSWFITCLTKVLLDEKYPASLTRRLTKVIAEVASLESSSKKQPEYSEKKQTPVIYSMLTKDIFMLPKNASC